jgi:tryptophanase
MSLVAKIKEMLKEYQEENGALSDRDYEKLFVHLYLQHEDEYLKQRVSSIRSDGKSRNYR